ncbi:hypothetical protein ACSBR2_023997 [Camellia fascicularis]
MAFAGHSSGGAMAMLATVWFLEEYLRPNSSQTTRVSTSFIELSPYRPFGTDIFCTRNGKLAVTNRDAVLQLLLYSSQLISEAESTELHDDIEDFHANITGLELAGMWDEIIEMLKRYELLDEFEGHKEWIELGTKTNLYKYMQRWREHAERIEQESNSESCFWAEVEDLRSNNKSFEDMKQRILHTERDVLKWVQHGEIGKNLALQGL